MTALPAAMRRVPFAVLLLRHFGVLVCAVLLALGALFYFGLNWLARGVADDSGARAAELLQVRTLAYLEEAGASVKLMAGYMQTAGERGVTVDREEAWRLMWGTMRNSPSVESLYIADAQGGYAQVSREPDIVTRVVDTTGTGSQELRIYRDARFRAVREERGATTFDPRTRPWFRNARPDLVSFTSEASDAGTARQAAVAVAFSVAGGSIGRVVGASVPLARLSDFVRQARPTPGSVVILVNADGEVLARTGLAMDAPAARQDPQRMVTVSNLGYPPLSEMYSRFMAAGIVPPTLDLAGEKYRFHARRFGGVGWVTLILTPEEEVLGQFSTLAAIVLYVLGAVFLVALLALMKLSRDLAQPITRLAAEAGSIRAFELERYRGVSSHIQEVAELGDALDSAVDALKGFKRYVPADLVRQLLASPDFARVGGREVDLTLFFSDIIGFTGITERMPPEELMRQMSDYFEVMTSVIMRHQGTVDKYIGDGIMAFWGAPTAIDDAPARACRAALECQQRVAELKQTWAAQGKPAFDTCIGIHTGRVVVGNFGSSDRLNYSAIGDGVNLAARVENVNRELGTRILITGETHALLAGRFACRPAGTITLRGRNTPTVVQELLGELGKSDASSHS